MTQYEIFKALHPRIVSGLFYFMHHTLKIKPPSMPNHYFYEVPAGRREDGFKPSHSVPIENLSEEEAIEFADMMRDEFIKHWKSKKGL